LSLLQLVETANEREPAFHLVEELSKRSGLA